MSFTTLVALIIGILIGVCGAMGLNVDRPGPDAGDWLGFAGALIGVVLTIIGTLWLERYKATAGDRESQEILLSSLREIETGLSRVAAPRGSEAIDIARAARIADEAGLLKSFNKFVYARHYVPKRNIEAWQAVEDLNEAICREKPTLEKEIAAISNAGDNENVLGVNINIMTQIHLNLIKFLMAAKRIVAAHQS